MILEQKQITSTESLALFLSTVRSFPWSGLYHRRESEAVQALAARLRVLQISLRGHQRGTRGTALFPILGLAIVVEWEVLGSTYDDNGDGMTEITVLRVRLRGIEP